MRGRTPSSWSGLSVCCLVCLFVCVCALFVCCFVSCTMYVSRWSDLSTASPSQQSERERREEREEARESLCRGSVSAGGECTDGCAVTRVVALLQVHAQSVRWSLPPCLSAARPLCCAARSVVGVARSAALVHSRLAPPGARLTSPVVASIALCRVCAPRPCIRSQQQQQRRCSSSSSA